MQIQALLCIIPTARFSYYQMDTKSRTKSGNTVSPESAVGAWRTSIGCPMR